MPVVSDERWAVVRPPLPERAPQKTVRPGMDDPPVRGPKPRGAPTPLPLRVFAPHGKLFPCRVACRRIASTTGGHLLALHVLPLRPGDPALHGLERLSRAWRRSGGPSHGSRSHRFCACRSPRSPPQGATASRSVLARGQAQAPESREVVEPGGEADDATDAPGLGDPDLDPTARAQPPPTEGACEVDTPRAVDDLAPESAAASGTGHGHRGVARHTVDAQTPNEGAPANDLQ